MQKKREEFFVLKHKLKNSIDSASKIVDYYNTYKKDGYYYFLSFANNTGFDWDGCNRYYRSDGRLITSERLGNSISAYSEFDNVTHVDIKINKKQYFNINLDGLSGEHIFYKEDLH